MKDACFHIGFGKTGSSALQGYLSLGADHGPHADGRRFLYCVILEDGTIAYGDKLANAATSLPLKYVTSSDPAVCEKGHAQYIKRQLDAIFQQGFIPVFSQEDWARRSEHFRESNFFGQLDCRVHIIVYVRPQVEWVNAGWWQWWAWSGQFSSPRDVPKAWGYDFVMWAKQISPLIGVPGVEGVTVRLQPHDIIDDFMGLFGLKAIDAIKGKVWANRSVGSTLIKLYRQFPRLRATHGAEVDSILTRFLKFDDKAPWVIEQDTAQEIIAATRSDNILLSAMMDDASRAAMERDPRWWNADHYQDRKVCSGEDLELTREDLLEIVKQAIPALIELGRRPS